MLLANPATAQDYIEQTLEILRESLMEKSRTHAAQTWVLREERRRKRISQPLLHIMLMTTNRLDPRRRAESHLSL
jgi:hypothetical protein